MDLTGQMLHGNVAQHAISSNLLLAHPSKKSLKQTGHPLHNPRCRVSSVWLWRRIDLDHIIDPQDRDGRLRGELEALDLVHGGFEHAALEVVGHHALHQIQSGEAVLRMLLPASVARAELRDELRGVLRGVDGERLGDHQQRLAEGLHGELLVRGERQREVAEVRVERRLHGAAAHHQRLALHHALLHAERVVEGPLHLAEHHIVRSAQHHRQRRVVRRRQPAEEHEIVYASRAPRGPTVAQPLLLDDLAVADRGGVDALLAVDRAHRLFLTPRRNAHHNHLAAHRLRHAHHVVVAHAADPDAPALHEVLQTEIVDGVSADDHIRPRAQQRLHLPPRDLHLLQLDPLQRLRVRRLHLDAHLQLVALQREVDHQHVRVLHAQRHLLRRTAPRQDDPVHQLALQGALPVRLHDTDVLDRVFVLAVPRNGGNGETLLGLGTNGFDGVNSHLGELLGLRSQDFGAERGLHRTGNEERYLGHVEQNGIGDLVTRNQQVFPDETDALFEGETVATHNQRGVHG